MICRRRYYWDGRRYSRQLDDELFNFELLQHLANAGVRVHREFCGGLIRIKNDLVFKLTKQQQKRLQLIMETDHLEEIM